MPSLPTLAATAANASDGGTGAAFLEYRFYLFSEGPVSVDAVVGPTLNFLPGRPQRYAVAIDDKAPQIVAVMQGGLRLSYLGPQENLLVAGGGKG